MPEIRAIWVARWSICSPDSVRAVVDTARECGFNHLVVQVRGRGDAFYRSTLEPRSEMLSGQPSDFDPLALALSEGRRAGLRVHAWINANFTWESAQPPVSPMQRCRPK